MKKGDVVQVIRVEFPGGKRVNEIAVVESIRDDGVFSAKFLKPRANGDSHIMLHPSDCGQTWEK